MVDPLHQKQQNDTEMLAVPKELLLSIQEIVNLYHYCNKQNVTVALKNLVVEIKEISDLSLLSNQNNNPILADSQSSLEAETEADFLKSWDDIFNVQVYIDTDIYGDLDPRPPALTEVDSSRIDSETIIQHTEATEAYVQTWKEIAQRMTSLPEDLFTRLWTTVEVSKILECSPNSLRRARRSGRLPIKTKNLILDCISHDGKRSLWFVRPA